MGTQKMDLFCAHLMDRKEILKSTLIGSASHSNTSQIFLVFMLVHDYFVFQSSLTTPPKSLDEVGGC